MREIFVSPDNPHTEAEQQDEAILDAVNRWLAGILSEESLIAFISERPFVSNKAGGDGAFVDVPGSIDIVVRLHNEHLLTDKVYDKILRARQARSTS